MSFLAIILFSRLSLFPSPYSFFHFLLMIFIRHIFDCFFHFLLSSLSWLIHAAAFALIFFLFSFDIDCRWCRYFSFFMMPFIFHFILIFSLDFFSFRLLFTISFSAFDYISPLFRLFSLRLFRRSCRRCHFHFFISPLIIFIIYFDCRLFALLYAADAWCHYVYPLFARWHFDTMPPFDAAIHIIISLILLHFTFSDAFFQMPIFPIWDYFNIFIFICHWLFHWLFFSLSLFFCWFHYWYWCRLRFIIWCLFSADYFWLLCWYAIFSPYYLIFFSMLRCLFSRCLSFDIDTWWCYVIFHYFRLFHFHYLPCFSFITMLPLLMPLFDYFSCLMPLLYDYFHIFILISPFFFDYATPLCRLRYDDTLIFRCLMCCRHIDIFHFSLCCCALIITPCCVSMLMPPPPYFSRLRLIADADACLILARFRRRCAIFWLLLFRHYYFRRDDFAIAAWLRLIIDALHFRHTPLMPLLSRCHYFAFAILPLMLDDAEMLIPYDISLHWCRWYAMIIFDAIDAAALYAADIVFFFWYDAWLLLIDDYAYFADADTLFSAADAAVYATLPCWFSLSPSDAAARRWCHITRADYFLMMILLPCCRTLLMSLILLFIYFAIEARLLFLRHIRLHSSLSSLLCHWCLTSLSLFRVFRHYAIFAIIFFIPFFIRSFIISLLSSSSRHFDYFISCSLISHFSYFVIDDYDISLIYFDDTMMSAMLDADIAMPILLPMLLRCRWFSLIDAWCHFRWCWRRAMMLLLPIRHWYFATLLTPLITIFAITITLILIFFILILRYFKITTPSFWYIAGRYIIVFATLIFSMITLPIYFFIFVSIFRLFSSLFIDYYFLSRWLLRCRCLSHWATLFSLLTLMPLFILFVSAMLFAFLFHYCYWHYFLHYVIFHYLFIIFTTLPLIIFMPPLYYAIATLRFTLSLLATPDYYYHFLRYLFSHLSTIFFRH